jgi:hypothetical protein
MELEKKPLTAAPTDELEGERLPTGVLPEAPMSPTEALMIPDEIEGERSPIGPPPEALLSPTEALTMPDEPLVMPTLRGVAVDIGAIAVMEI